LLSTIFAVAARNSSEDLDRVKEHDCTHYEGDGAEILVERFMGSKRATNVQGCKTEVEHRQHKV